jgi:hypothetical protein
MDVSFTLLADLKDYEVVSVVPKDSSRFSCRPTLSFRSRLRGIALKWANTQH